MKRILAALIVATFALVVPAPRADATTRFCFFAHSQVQGSVATTYVGGALPVQKRVVVNATTFYHEDVSFAPDRYWRLSRVYGPGISTTTVPRTGYTYNRAGTWYFEFRVNQGFTTNVVTCSVAN